MSNRERVGRGLDLLRDGLGLWAATQLRADLPEHEAAAAINRFFRDGKAPAVDDPDDLVKHMDPYQILLVMWDFWRQCFHDQLGHQGRNYVSELREVRNEWAHGQPFSVDNAHRALDSMTRLLDMASAEQAEDVRKLATEVIRQKLDAELKRSKKRAAEEVATGQVQGLKPWREVVQPHPDVASGSYAQAEFAANLWEVHQGRAGAEYGDPVEFFRRTFPTEGIRRLARMALERVCGRGGEPVVEMQTSFGGGKTHSLLVLYHLLGGGIKPDSADAVELLLQGAGIDSPPKANLAVLVGTRLTPARSWRKPDGTEIRTMWGEMAWQLGGAAGYAMVAEADQKAVNPGAELLQQLLDRYAPAVVLVDEWVVFARQLVDRTDLPAGTFEANQSFAQSLTEAAASADRAMVVVALPESDIEKGGPAGERALEHLRHVLRRMEGLWRPATAEEGFEIVRRRLFLPVADVAARDATCRAFSELYQRHRGDFPSECIEAAYESRMQRAYPIHPELFDRLYSDWSTIERFQRTRGVLRLMAKVIHHLWERGDQAPLILPGTMPLDASDLQTELTQYLAEGWDAILDTDVDGPTSRPLKLDGKNPSFGKAQAARRVTRTVFLGSAPSVATQQVRGLELVRVKLGAAMPGDSPSLYGDALAHLGEELTYLYADGTRNWYDTRANVNRTASDRASQIKSEAVEDAIVELLRARRKRGLFAAVHAAPDASSDVPDEQQLRLVILGPQAEWVAKQETSPAHTTAAEILGSRGASPRTWQNLLVFLAPERSRLRELEKSVRSWLAWRSVVADIRSEQLNVDTFQRRNAEGKLSGAEDAVQARLVETWCRLLVPQQQGTAAVSWVAEKLPSGDGSFEERAGRKLTGEGHVVADMGPDYLLKFIDDYNLWRDGDHIDVRQLWDWHCQYLYLPRLADQDVLLCCIQDAARRIGDSPFAYADSYDESKGRYLGLHFDGDPTAIRADGVSVVVRIDRARQQRQQDEATKPDVVPIPPGTGTGTGTGPGPGPGTGTGPGPGPDLVPPVVSAPRRFHGSVQLPALGIGGKAGEIGDEVLQHLAKLSNANLEISLEIQCHLPEGAPEDIRRIVEENCRTLKFTDFGFEEE
jgi:predicted AAA+ superfamily ATPase